MSADEFHGDSRVAVDSTGDGRIVNNVVRHEYRVLSEREKEQMKSIKDLGRDFIEYLDHVERSGPPVSSRELALAKTKVQEAVMWAVNHVTK